MRNARKARNGRIVCNFLYKKARNRKKSHFSHNFLQFFVFFAFIILSNNFSSYSKNSRNAICKKQAMQEYARNNAIREILFIMINHMQEICKKCEKFEKCNHYHTCLSIIPPRFSESGYQVKLSIWMSKIWILNVR